MEFSKQYSPKEFEHALYTRTEELWLFQPSEKSATGRTFYIPIPPPNVTGNLHIGHALTLTLEDIMVRYHRMRGDSTVWIPGTDHAGIATQARVENFLLNKVNQESHLVVKHFLMKFGNGKMSMLQILTIKLGNLVQVLTGQKNDSPLMKSLINSLNIPSSIFIKRDLFIEGNIW